MRLVSWNLQWCRGMDGAVDPARVALEAVIEAPWGPVRVDAGTQAADHQPVIVEFRS